ncbi:hypothetical protein SISSUDRAFT_241627 [Sistotremastrum suecicum HHB10207 ss-3]|uniref:Uncharacterized protein n=1 Tax=Sistotremastrum suecicum HHB10207 ss-3 TaxID=1314776 RepID=A0A166A0H3_9AGAM|nr:hypothetical protein SISSUDRAFT_241627 [Sistotremastrum suecicum HHB10207 ss-3]
MSKILRPLYLSLEILGGHIGLPLLLIAFQFVKHKRSPVVFHFCVTWIIFSVAGSMTVYGPTPLEALTSQGLCLLTQAADDGATIMTSLATLSLLLNLYFCLIQPSWYVDRQWRKRVELTLAYTPYVGFFIFFFQTYAWSAPISGQPGKSTFSDNFCNFTGCVTPLSTPTRRFERDIESYGCPPTSLQSAFSESRLC